MFALQDGNAFYCSAERIFQPQLRRVPLCVLSNNDGAVIARSGEAKALGIKMGHPAFELRGWDRRYGLHLRSANFTLYGDISARVLQVVRDLAPRVEPYSIDENFLDLTGVREPVRLAHEVRERVSRWVGIPNCVGLGPSKTLAKAANKMAKAGEGVVDLSDQDQRDRRLAIFPIEDVWGVGRRLAPRLAELGIHTAAHLRDAPPDDILSAFGVTLSRTQRELQGYSCMELAEVEPDRQQIVVSRSFGARVESLQSMHEAVATFGVRAMEKLRARGLVTCAVGVFMHSDSFRPELRQHHASRALSLPASTADTTLILKCVRQLVLTMHRPGIAYKKAGVVLQDLARPESLQGDLFAPATIGKDRLMSVMDQINQRFGRGTAGLGASGWQQRPDWGMRQEHLSPDYTTSVRDLPPALC